MDKWKPSFINPKQIEDNSRKDFDHFSDVTKGLDDDKDREKIWFEWAVMTVQDILGIRLTNIEIVGLRAIARQVFKEIDQQGKGNQTLSRIDPQTEIPVRFLFEFYGIHSIDELRKAFPPEKDENGEEIWPTQKMHEYFHRLQAKLHHEI